MCVEIKKSNMSCDFMLSPVVKQNIQIIKKAANIDRFYFDIHWDRTTIAVKCCIKRGDRMYESYDGIRFKYKGGLVKKGDSLVSEPLQDSHLNSRIFWTLPSIMIIMD